MKRAWIFIGLKVREREFWDLVIGYCLGIVVAILIEKYFGHYVLGVVCIFGAISLIILWKWVVEIWMWLKSNWKKAGEIAEGKEV